VICPKCAGPLKPLTWPALSVQCYHCNAKYLVSITTSDTTKATYSVHGVYKPKQEVPQAFQDAFAGKELEP
jgi:hypothetical protein